MDRTEALKVFGLGPEPDRQEIEESYWTRVRAARGRRASSEIEDLNEAYAVLSPSRRERPRPWFPDGFVLWIGRESGRMQRRWPGRNPEIVLILASTIVLALFALVAGSDPVYVGIPLAIVFVAAWAPWRALETTATPETQAPRRKRAA